MKIEYVTTKMTRYSRADQDHLLSLINGRPGNTLSLDVVDPQGEVGHVVVYRDADGHHYAEPHTPDPRNLYARLRRKLRVKALRLAVRPEEKATDVA